MHIIAIYMPDKSYLTLAASARISHLRDFQGAVGFRMFQEERDRASKAYL